MALKPSIFLLFGLLFLPFISKVTCNNEEAELILLPPFPKGPPKIPIKTPPPAPPIVPVPAPPPATLKPSPPVPPKAPTNPPILAPPVKTPPKSAPPVTPPITKPPAAPTPPTKIPPPLPPVSPPAPAPQMPPVRSKADCIPLCGQRCKLHSRKRLCMRACTTCCDRCKCVPPGTYGNREMCGKCYTDMTTHGGKPKCP